MLFQKALLAKPVNWGITCWRQQWRQRHRIGGPVGAGLGPDPWRRPRILRRSSAGFRRQWPQNCAGGWIGGSGNGKCGPPSNFPFWWSQLWISESWVWCSSQPLSSVWAERSQQSRVSLEDEISSYLIIIISWAKLSYNCDQEKTRQLILSYTFELKPNLMF